MSLLFLFDGPETTAFVLRRILFDENAKSLRKTSRAISVEFPRAARVTLDGTSALRVKWAISNVNTRAPTSSSRPRVVSNYIATVSNVSSSFPSRRRSTHALSLPCNHLRRFDIHVHVRTRRTSAEDNYTVFAFVFFCFWY